MKRHFKIATDQGIQIVFAEQIEVGQFKCFYTVDDHGEFDKITITEYYSGMKVCSLVTPDFISPHRMAEELLSSHDEGTIKKHCIGQLNFYGLKYPLNP